MTSAIDVAAYILDQLKRTTTMKLQKLVYYSQVRYLLKTDAPLFYNRIEAWANGPVVPDLFRCHAGQYMIERSDLGPSDSFTKLSETERAAVIEVVDLFGSCSGEDLRRLTHEEAPWVDARAGCKPSDRCSEEITIDALRRYYASPACSNPVAKR